MDVIFASSDEDGDRVTVNASETIASTMLTVAVDSEDAAGDRVLTVALLNKMQAASLHAELGAWLNQRGEG